MSENRQFLDQLAHALRMKERHPHDINAACHRLLSRAIWERYLLCVDLGLGADADTLVFKHRFEVAR